MSKQNQEEFIPEQPLRFHPSLRFGESIGILFALLLWPIQFVLAFIINTARRLGGARVINMKSANETSHKTIDGLEDAFSTDYQDDLDRQIEEFKQRQKDQS